MQEFSLISIVLRCSFAPYQQVIHDYYTGIPSKKLFNETLKDNRSGDDSKRRPAKPLLASSVENTVTLAMRDATSWTVLIKSDLNQSDLMPLVQQSFNQITSANQAAKMNNGVLWAPRWDLLDQCRCKCFRLSSLPQPFVKMYSAGSDTSVIALILTIFHGYG